MVVLLNPELSDHDCCNALELITIAAMLLSRCFPCPTVKADIVYVLFI